MKKAHVSYQTIKNALPDKPNEDALAVDAANNLYIIADGVGRLRNADGSYPITSHAAAAAQIFVSSALNHALQASLKKKPLRALDLQESLIAANHAIAEYNRIHVPNPDFGINDYAGAVGIALHVTETTLEFAYIGDCQGAVVKKDTLEEFTEVQTKALYEYQKASSTPIDEVTGRRDLRNHKNHPLSWGVLTGEASALDFIQSGNIPYTEDITRIFLCTDGLAPLLRELSELSIQAEITTLIEAVIGLEQTGKLKTDDKSIILIEQEPTAHQHVGERPLGS